MNFNSSDMSTNYYLRHKPTSEQISDLKEMITLTANGECFTDVINMVDSLYREPDEFSDSDEWGILHLGKRSSGWKFRWCTNIIKKNCSYMDNGRYVQKYEYILRYPLTKQGIKDFIMRDDVVVVDEYGSVEDKLDFLEMAFNWEYDDPCCADSSHLWNFTEDQKKFESFGITFDSKYQSSFDSDGLRFSIYDNFS